MCSVRPTGLTVKGFIAVMITLKNHSTESLIEVFYPEVKSIPAIRQIQLCAVKRRMKELPSTLDGVSKSRWELLKSKTRISHLRLEDSVVSPTDGFKKYVFSGEESGRFETVRIPLVHRPGSEKYIVCVSSQVGCAAGCAFCATGRMGFKRNLQTWEIVDQIIQIQNDSVYPVRGVVFMGMGEPFLNYRNVTEALKIISDPCGLGIDSKAVTVSTVGVVPMIEKFTEEGFRQRLIVSLTSAIDSKRDQLLPMNLNYPISKIVRALKTYQKVRGRKVTFAWTMMRGVNMGLDEVEALREISQELDMILDVIPVNDTTGRFFPPSEQEYKEFHSLLNEHLKCPVVRRYSGGADVAAACGMLAQNE